MKIIEGISASHGITIGEALLYTQELTIPKFSIFDIQIELEINRFYNALRKARVEYEELRDKIVKEMSEDEGKFLDAHILMTDDPVFIQTVTEKIREEKKNVEYIVYQVTEDLAKKFNSIEDEYFKERAVEILDLGKKVIRILLAKKSFSLSDLEKDVIVISTDLSVSDTASMNKRHVLGFITEFGGKTSHAALLARALGIPAIVGAKNISHLIATGDIVILDGNSGKIIIEPDEKALEKYKKKKKEYDEEESKFLKLKDLESKTIDGKKILLKANMEIPEQEIDAVLQYGSDGIGLYRSEFLYLTKKKKSLPNEEQQFNAYKFILEKFQNQSVTIRTLDLGGDKVLEELNFKESNPYLGWRAVRFCLDHPEIFKTQLRSLYRASIYGNLRILLPMISNVDEVIATKSLIEEVKRDLKKEGFKFKENIPFGIMIETPGAVMISDILAKMCDFFSIGTNDLIQYTLACDRGNEKVAKLYDALHPSVLKLIKLTTDNAHKNNIKVSVCGEMASEVENVIILIGLNIDELSMSPVSILEVKKAIRSLKFSECNNLVEDILNCSNSAEVRKKLYGFMGKKLKWIKYL